ncbi:extracellular solute-binding protein [Propionibacteriaceae bacterium Y2011]
MMHIPDNVTDMSRRTFLAGTGALGLASLATSCGGTEPGSKAGASSAPPGSLSGDVSVLTPQFGGTEGKQVMDGIIASFNEVHPAVTVTVDYTGFDKLNEKLTVAIAGGSVPDVIMTGVGWIPPFAHKKLFAEFDTKFIEGLEFTGPILEPCTYQEGLFAVPLLLDTRQVIYNRTMWDRAGIKEAPASFEDLRAAAKELTGGSGSTKQWGIILNGQGSPRQLLATLIGAGGSTMFSADGRTAQLNSPEAVAGLQLVVDMIKDGSTSWELKAAEGSPHPFLTDNVAMAPVSAPVWPSWNEANPALMSEEGSGYFLPQETQPAAFLGGTLLSRAASSQNAEAADALIKHFVQPDVMEEVCVFGNSVPGLASVLENSEVLRSNRLIAAGVQNLEFAVSEGGSPAWMEIRGKLDPILEEAFIGQSGVQEALDKANQMAQEAIDRA